MLLEVNHVSKIYQSHNQQTTALKNIEFGVKQGEFVAIMGESGSGKTTLLNLLATFDQPTQGEIRLNGQIVDSFEQKDLAKFRREKIGFVFQDFNVLDQFNNRDNILLPLVLSGYSVQEMENRLKPLIALLGLEALLERYPYEISGGQRQRVAIARALITKPEILLADEPTGALDSKTSEEILELFDDINREGNAILMVTHSLRAASYASRVLFIRDGTVFHEIYKGNQTPREFQEKISEALSFLQDKEVKK